MVVTTLMEGSQHGGCRWDHLASSRRRLFTLKVGRGDNESRCILSCPYRCTTYIRIVKAKRRSLLRIMNNPMVGMCCIDQVDGTTRVSLYLSPESLSIGDFSLPGGFSTAGSELESWVMSWRIV